jgi:hypothetical protein
MNAFSAEGMATLVKSYLDIQFVYGYLILIFYEQKEES